MENQRTPAYDFIIKQGITFKRRIRLKVAGVVQPLTGSIVRLFARPNDSSPAIDLSSDDDPQSSNQYVKIDTTDPDDNFVEIFFSDETTDSLTWSYSDYRLDFTDSDDIVRRKLKGRLIVEQEIN